MADSIVMPKTLTAENGAKALLLGEFFEIIEHQCEECADQQYSDGCEACGGSGYILQKVYVSWNNIKDIYKKVVSHVAIDGAVFKAE